MRKLLVVLILGALVVFVAIPYFQSPKDDRSFGAIDKIVEAVGGSEPDGDVLTLPANGAHRIYGNNRTDNHDPTFTINNKRNNSCLFIKFENPRTGSVAAEFFARPRKEVKARMLAGEFRVKVAFGNTWYGREKLFGKETETYVLSGVQKLEGVPVGGTSRLSIPRGGWFYTAPGVYMISAWQEWRSKKSPDGARSIPISDW